MHITGNYEGKGPVHCHQSVKYDFVTDAISGIFIGCNNMIKMLFLALIIHPLNFQDAGAFSSTLFDP